MTVMHDNAMLSHEARTAERETPGRAELAEVPWGSKIQGEINTLKHDNQMLGSVRIPLSFLW